MRRNIFKIAAIASLGTLLFACTVSDDDDTIDSDVDVITITDDTTDVEITNDTTYSVNIQSDGFFPRLFDEIEDISISGDTNIVTIEEDTSVETVTITGSNNIIQYEGSSLSVETLIITGEDNIIYADSVTTVNIAAGVGNDVCEDVDTCTEY